MHNWSVDTHSLSKDKEKYTVWRLEQLINYGLNGEKINTSDLKKYLRRLHIDPQKKRYLELLLQE
jgi:hypothetical protein